MNESNDETVRQLLRKVLPPVVDAGPERDLWLEVRQRLDQQRLHVSWFDWALAAAVVVCLVLTPELLPVLLYHL